MMKNKAVSYTSDGYTIRELMEMFSTTQHTVRNYLKVHKIEKIGRNINNTRENMYSKKIVEKMKNDGFIIGGSREMYSNQQIMEIFNWDRKELFKESKLRDMEPLIIRGKKYFTQEMVKELKSKKNRRICISDLRDNADYDLSLLLKHVEKKEVPYLKYNQGRYFKREDLLRILKSKEYQKELTPKKVHSKRCEATRRKRLLGFENNLSFEEMIDMELTEFAFGFQKTKEYFKEYILSRCEDHSDKTYSMIQRYAKEGIKLSFILKKELAEYSDDELVGLITEYKKSNKRYIGISFIEYLFARPDINVTFNAVYEITPMEADEKYSAVEAYDEDEWFQLTSFLCDIGRHELKAIESKEYAQCWVFMLMHLFLGWRKMDMCKLPTPSFHFVAAPFDKAQFGQNEAEIIIRSIALKSENLVAAKTGAPLHFVYPPVYMRLAFGLGVYILDWHREQEQRDTLLEERIIKAYAIKLEKMNFFDGFALDDFSFGSKKANTSLLGNMYSTAVKMKGYAAQAYKLSAFMRSHMSNIEGVNDTTAIYIAASSAERDIDEVSVALQQRGTFGFVYKDLLSIIGKGKETFLDFDQTTNAMVSLRNALTPMDVQIINGYILNSMDEEKDVIGKILSLSEEERNTLFKRLAHCECAGKEKYVQCLNPGECKHVTASSCIGCKYAIMSLEIGYKISKRIHEQSERIKNAANTNLRLKEQNELIGLIHLAKEFYDTFAYLGKDFVNEVIPLEHIKSELVSLREETMRLNRNV